MYNDTKFFVGQNPMRGIGTEVTEAPTSAEAIRLAGLDWDVHKVHSYFPTKFDNADSKNLMMLGLKQSENFSIVRDSDFSELGSGLSGRYQIVQNREAFDFTDKLLGEGVTYETAGSAAGGKRIWLTARMPSTTILGDEVEPYMVFTNSHDGTGAVKVAITPIRVICQNTLTLALKRASRVASIKHCGDIGAKIHEAEKVLGLANTYMDTMSGEAETFQNVKISDKAFNRFLDEMFPMPKGKSEEEITARAKANIDAQREAFTYLYKEKDDIKKFGQSGWALLNAAADFVPHFKPARTTDTYQENNFMKIVDGGKNNLMDKASEFVYKIA